MNYLEIDRALTRLVQKRNQQHETPPAATQKELEQAESAFLEQYGSKLRAVLQAAYELHFVEKDLASLLDYLAPRYREVSENDNGPTFDVGHDQGVPVTPAGKPGQKAKVVLVPNPLRILLNIDAHTREELWSVSLNR